MIVCHGGGLGVALGVVKGTIGILEDNTSAIDHRI